MKNSYIVRMNAKGVDKFAGDTVLYISQKALECRSMVGLPTLDRQIGVRIPALQSEKRGFNASLFLYL